MSRPWVKRRWQRGDTMVEVLIAIAIVSLILGGAYVTTNRSLQATRGAQERSIALKLAESQIERLKGLVTSGDGTVFAIATPFCISAATGQPVQDNGQSANQPCTVDASGNQTGTEPIFHLSITRSPLNNNQFTLSETWFDVSGRVQDSLQLRYRVYD